MMATTTGTTNFNPAVGDLVLSAFARLQMRRTELTQQHLTDAATESNLVQVEFCNRQPNSWSYNLYSVVMTQGVSTYQLPSSMICFGAVYISTSSGGTTIDRICAPLSQYEYSALPNKQEQAFPNQYWFHRNITPEIIMWPVPDNTQTYTLNLRYLKQIEDASIASGSLIDMPYRWIDAFVAALASRLAQIYKPELSQVLDAKAERSWTIAAKEDSEDAPIYILPGLSFYSC